MSLTQRTNYSRGGECIRQTEHGAWKEIWWL